MAAFTKSREEQRFSPMKFFLKLVVLAALTILANAQTPQPSASEWSAKSKRAQKTQWRVGSRRCVLQANVFALKRVNPSLRELELVCTAALTGRKGRRPNFLWS